MRTENSMSRNCGWIALTIGLAQVPWALGNGGPFLIKYPGGDPAAKGVLARLDPDLKPAREERLRVVKEDLKILFLPDPMLDRRRSAPVPAPAPAAAVQVPAPGTASLAQPPSPAQSILQDPPLAIVSAIYTIENPTDEAIEVEFGFPILRGVFMSRYTMMPSPDAQVKLDTESIRADLISNSMIYGLIRQRSQEVINKALAADPELARLVAKVRTVGYVRQRAREAIHRVMGGQAGLPEAVQADTNLGKLIAAPSDAADPDRTAARQALMDYLTDKKKWNKGQAILMVEYASTDLGEMATIPLDAGSYAFYFGDPSGINRLASANLGRLAAIGEQKTTQLFAELAARFDPSVKATYEALFAAWGGDVRERAVDFKTGQIRPREITLDPKLTGRALTEAGSVDPTLYARMDYISPNVILSEGEKASCEAVIKNLPVTFTFAPMNLLHYQAKFPAKSTRTLTVSYKQYAYADTREPASYQLAYVVHPASLWKSFGPIELEVAVPEGLSLRTSVPSREAGVETRERPSDLPGPNPPQGSLKVTVHRATLTDKTGELFLAVDANGWRQVIEPKPDTAPKQFGVKR